jgi:tRNA dimethylallyltransferase
MPSAEGKKPLIAIIGPTAVGKTEVAIQLAGRLMGEIISADSRLFYRGMDIGTAKPTTAERAEVHHHLIDVADPDDIWSLAQFQAAAQDAIEKVYDHGKIPFLVGGTGQYFRAVTEGWVIPTVGPDPQLRTVLDHWATEVGPEGLHARLAVIDPPAAAQIDPRNLRRTIRALEVIFGTGQRFSVLRRRRAPKYALLTLGLWRPRPELYTRIDQRVETMIQSGFLAEVERLLAMGYSPDLPSLSAIGYLELCAVAAGKLTLDEAVTQIKRRTRQFVRRQANWFKMDDPNIHWFKVENGTVEEMESTIRQFLLI